MSSTDKDCERNEHGSPRGTIYELPFPGGRQTALFVTLGCYDALLKKLAAPFHEGERNGPAATSAPSSKVEKAQLALWEWVKESCRTNSDHAVLVRLLSDGNFSFLHGDPSADSATGTSEAQIRIDECERLLTMLDAYGPASDYGPPIERRIAGLKAPADGGAKP